MTADTAATAALGPEPIPGSGPGATADDTPVARAHFRAWEDQLAAEQHLLAPDPAPLPHRHDRPGHRRTRPALRPGVRRVRQPPRGRLPGLLGHLQARRPPARPRRARRRQGHPRDDHRASVRVRHPHRAVVRPGPLPADARQDRPALPPPPRRQGPPLPARPRHLLPDPPPRGRPPARPAHVRRLLRLPGRGAVQRLRGRPVAPVHHLPAPPARPPPGHHPERPARPGPDPVRQGRRVPGTRRRPLPRRHPAGRPRRGLPGPAPRHHRRGAVRRHRPGRRCRRCRHRAPGPGRQARLRRADRHPDHPPRSRTCPAPARRSTASPWPTTSPSTPPRP